MANYADQDDIEFRLPATTLAQLTDDVNGNIVNSAVITRAIVDAMSTVNSFCRGKQNVPFDPVPDNVRRWTVSLSILNLYNRRTQLLLPPAVKEDVEITKMELRGVRDNKIMIDDASSDANQANMYVIKSKQNQPIFQTNSSKNGRLDRYFGPHDGLDNV